MNAGSLMRRVLAGAGAMALGLTGALAVTTTAVANTAALANIDLDREGSITITKYAQPEADATSHDGTELDQTPGHDVLGGVEFTVRSVSIDLSTNDGWAAVQALSPYTAGDDRATVEGGAAYGLGDTVSKTIATDRNGVAAFDHLPVGVYLVEETNIGAHPITNRAAPFYVTIPLPQASGTWLYDVFVYPKNAVTSIGKAVDEAAAVALGSTLSWPIRINVPHLTDGTRLDRLTVTDELDSRLRFDGVTVSPASLALETDYTVSQSAGEDGRVTVVVDFTAAGRAALEGQQGEDVVVTVHTTVTSIGDGTIVNTAVINVNDYEGTTLPVHSKWGAIKIFKYSTVTEGAEEIKRPLQGAEFQVFTTGADASAATNPISVVVDGEKIDTFVSGTDGNVLVPGLLVNNSSGEREYFIRETKAPTGYQNLPDDKNPVAVMVKAGSIEQTEVRQVENFQYPVLGLPMTGGTGTVVFSVAGVTLMVIAVAVVVAGRRRSATSRA